VQFTAQTATHQLIFVYHSLEDINDHDKEKRREQNLFLRSSKSETEVTITTEDCVQRFELLKLTTDGHEASRGLSVTAWLFLSLALAYVINILINALRKKN